MRKRIAVGVMVLVSGWSPGSVLEFEGEGAVGGDQRGVSLDAVAALIRELRHDGQRWNASSAMRAIRAFDEPPVAALQAALDSDDWQQRQIAADWLWVLAEPPSYSDRAPAGRVTMRLLEVTVEGLARDEWRVAMGGRAEVTLSNAADGFRRLVRHAARARPALEKGLESEDSQQRLLCAMALGYGRVSASAEAAARVLLPHLRDNTIPEDARWCVGALYGLGEAVRPYLEQAAHTADRQQADLIELVLLDLENPTDTETERRARARLNTVTNLMHDPAVEWRIHHSMWWLRYLPE